MMKQNGFTLVELLVSLSIFAMFLLAFTYALGVELRFWEQISNFSRQQQLGNIIISRLAGDIRGASMITSDSDANKLVILKGGEIIEFSLVKQKVKRKMDASSSYLTDAGEITKLVFSYPVVKGKMMVEIIADNFKTRIGLRN